jgi:SAM-dependent methyltransferase
MPLLDDTALEASSVVAHRFMNRERELRGGNGYAREIGLDPFDYLTTCLQRRAHPRWLDLCCGSGRALIQTAELAREAGVADRIRIVGIDLAGRFWRSERLESLELIERSAWLYEPEARFDLITCVHGLHYVGDKLGLIRRACTWLADDARFVATLDLGTLRLRGAPAKRTIARTLRHAGLDVDTRRHRVARHGPARIEVPWTYSGADDRGGPSFTGEPAVISHYDAEGEDDASIPRQ